MSFERASRETPNLPWCCTDWKKLGQVISNFREEQEKFLGAWAEKWFENFQFVYGNHDIRWSKRWGFAVDVDFVRRERSVNKKSQTDVTRRVYEALVSLVFGNMPGWDVTASDDSQVKGKRFRSIVQGLLDCYMQRLVMATEINTMAGIFAGYGYVASKVDWNNCGGRLIREVEEREEIVPVYTTQVRENGVFGLIETPVQAIDQNGIPMQQKRIVEVKGPDGQVLYKTRWSGDARVTALTGFEYIRENMNGGAHKAKWHQHQRIMDFDDFVSEYGEMEGKTPYYNLIKPGLYVAAAYQTAVRHYMRMAYVTPQTTMDSRRGNVFSAENDLKKSKVLVVEHYDRPHKDKWASGRIVVVVNGYCTHVTKPKFSTNKIDGWHPFSEAMWLSLAPANMATGPLNPVTAKNKEVDMLDSLIDTSSYRNMGSLALVKAGMGIDLQKIYGEPGQIIEAAQVDGVMRWVRDELPIPPIVPELRKMKMEDIYDDSGAGDAIRGDRSKNVSSGYALKQLQEREQQRLTAPRQAFERFIASTGEKLVQCIKQCAKGDLGDDVYGFLMRSAAGEFSKEDVTAFLNTPIEYGVDVNVEPGSMTYRSKASKQATLLEIGKTQAGMARMQDPNVFDNVLKEFGIECLRDNSSAHRDRAQKENEVFSDIGRLGPDGTGVQLPIAMPMDDDDIHIISHELDAVKTADNLQQNEFELFVRTLHIEMHKLQKQEKMGIVPPGTSLGTAQMMMQAAGQPNVTLQQAAQTQQQKMSQPQPGQPQASAPQAPQKPGQPHQQANPQAPKGIKPVGQPGARPVDPGAPSENTPPGNRARVA